jgi:hypothetical protein
MQAGEEAQLLSPFAAIRCASDFNYDLFVRN